MSFTMVFYVWKGILIYRHTLHIVHPVLLTSSTVPSTIVDVYVDGAVLVSASVPCVSQRTSSTPTTIGQSYVPPYTDIALTHWYLTSTQQPPIGYSSHSWKPLHLAPSSLAHHSTRGTSLTFSDCVAIFGPSLPTPSSDFSSMTIAPTSTTTSHGDCQPPSTLCT